MKVNPNQLVDGCILAKDVMALTPNPIIPKKTVINEDHVKWLNAFIIQEVEVEPKLVSGELFQPKELTEDPKQALEGSDLISAYLSAVQEYKKLFKNWQANVPIDMPAVRKFIVPLLEKTMENASEVFSLHHYCTKEEYTYHHPVSVAMLSALIGRILKFEKGDWIQIGIAGVMSDSGMAKLDPKIINKSGPLSPQEYNEVKLHPEYSYNMLKQVTVLKEDVRKAVLQHHERIDGSGYPSGIKNEHLHPYAKIVSVADVFHAMTSERSYRSKQSPYKVLESIIQDDFGKFDLRVVQALTKAMTNFSTGTRVKLSNNQIGEIVFIEQKYPTRPMVKLDNGDILQLSTQRQLFIDEVL